MDDWNVAFPTNRIDYLVIHIPRRSREADDFLTLRDLYGYWFGPALAVHFSNTVDLSPEISSRFFMKENTPEDMSLLRLGKNSRGKVTTKCVEIPSKCGVISGPVESILNMMYARKISTVRSMSTQDYNQRRIQRWRFYFTRGRLEKY